MNGKLSESDNIEDICTITVKLDRIEGVEGIERNMMAFGKRWKFAGDFGGFL
jgi:hypothetical protein